MSGMYKGWKGAGGSGGEWKAKGVLQLPLGHRQWCCVFSKGQKQGYNPQDRQRWLLAVVWHHSHPY